MYLNDGATFSIGKMLSICYLHESFKGRNVTLKEEIFYNGKAYSLWGFITGSNIKRAFVHITDGGLKIKYDNKGHYSIIKNEDDYVALKTKTYFAYYRDKLFYKEHVKTIILDPIAKSAEYNWTGLSKSIRQVDL
ncbi:MAG: hypothetical protein ACMG6E_02325 [Candidatus Roizmanbacteria bacterium]